MDEQGHDLTMAVNREDLIRVIEAFTPIPEYQPSPQVSGGEMIE
jgi:hypothetical protein